MTAFRPDGAIFDAITNGKGLMGSYGGNLPVRDRWAIVAYIRALQLSQHATLAEALAEEQTALLTGKPIAPAADAGGTGAGHGGGHE